MTSSPPTPKCLDRHWADRPILRDFFWFLVLPHRLQQWAEPHIRWTGEVWLCEGSGIVGLGDTPEAAKADWDAERIDSYEARAA